jgi:methylated-DNA-[protein]-cysteine S-methyltransferase
MHSVYRILDTPLGPLTLVGHDETLQQIRFPRPGGEPDIPEGSTACGSSLAAASKQLGEYFEGSRRVFELAVAPEGTPFQQTVWKALQDIPWGETRSYGAVSAAIGRAGAARAVGAANGRNPIPIVIPCHRVIGSDGSLTGFAGGLQIKRQLLALEERTPDFW